MMIMQIDDFLKDTPCIYKIENLVDGKVYVGRTKCLLRRYRQYVYDLRERRIGHLNDYLYNSMMKYGSENFRMSVLEYCDPSIIRTRELYWMVALFSVFRPHGYNIRMDSSTGMVTSKITSDKISGNLKSQWASGLRNDHAEKLRKSWIGRDDWKNTAASHLRKHLTKWNYDVIAPSGEVMKSIGYEELSRIGLKSALSAFHRSGSNTVTCKNHIITRNRVVGEQNDG